MHRTTETDPVQDIAAQLDRRLAGSSVRATPEFLGTIACAIHLYRHDQLAEGSFAPSPGLREKLKSIARLADKLREELSGLDGQGRWLVDDDMREWLAQIGMGPLAMHIPHLWDGYEHALDETGEDKAPSAPCSLPLSTILSLLSESATFIERQIDAHPGRRANASRNCLVALVGYSYEALLGGTFSRSDNRGHEPADLLQAVFSIADPGIEFRHGQIDNLIRTSQQQIAQWLSDRSALDEYLFSIGWPSPPPPSQTRTRPD